MTSRWVSHGPNISPARQVEEGFKGRVEGSMKGGPLPCRPPDPTAAQYPHITDALATDEASTIAREGAR